MFAIAFSLGMLWGAFGLATFLVIISKRDSRPLRDRTAQRGRLRLVGGGREQVPRLSGGRWA